MDIFWDVDTQYDFMEPDGKLYVNGAEKIKGKLSKLTTLARNKGIPVVASIDYHSDDDVELSDNPDFLVTFPPHCLAGSEGAEKVPETRSANTHWIDEKKISTRTVDLMMQREESLVLRKQQFDVFSNPNAAVLLQKSSPQRIFIYGVALDVCVAHAINGMIERGYGERIILVEDAVKAINPQRGNEMIEEWKMKGVNTATTAEVEKLLG